MQQFEFGSRWFENVFFVGVGFSGWWFENAFCVDARFSGWWDFVSLRRRWFLGVCCLNVHFAPALDFPVGGLKMHLEPALEFPGDGYFPLK